jgi:negative regulator of flagellin synthesis FlgM
MKINGSIPKNLSKIYQKQQNSIKENIKGRKKFEQDKIELSPQAEKINKLIEMTKEIPEIRKEKVEEIKAQIAENKYDVSAKELAEKMLKK